MEENDIWFENHRFNAIFQKQFRNTVQNKFTPWCRVEFLNCNNI